MIETKNRRIVTEIPAPEAADIYRKLETYEPLSMQGQPKTLWDKAEGYFVMDRFGNRWIDFSSGVLVTASGHGQPSVIKAIEEQLATGVLHNYCFPSEIRGQLVEKIATLCPEPLKKVMLLTTGSEAVECALKLARTYGPVRGETKRTGIISFTHAFHGRTFGSQIAGGIPDLKSWIPLSDDSIYHVAYPDGFRWTDVSFESFGQQLAEQQVDPATIACVISETFQGCSAQFAPPEYFQKVRAWCDDHGVLLVFDEVQAAFGRTGKMFGFEHFNVVPDIACFGKGISGNMPLSAVVGRPDVMDLYKPGSMTSTHTGNPICCAAALANLDLIEDLNLVKNSRRLGDIALKELTPLVEKYPKAVGAVQGRGLVVGIHCIQPGTETEPNNALAARIVKYAVQHGVMLFAPVGVKGGTIKVCPPLIIDEQALLEGISVLYDAFAACAE
jgi:4-aminobutyrate aminotransferase / (S)-3-amino-2-methylpropionate transaminase / 5-aminovalerate transaminase